MLIGVLALQGAFREHIVALERCGVKGKEIRKKEQLNGLDGLIIPGGESTTIGRLMVDFELLNPIRYLMEEGLPVFGTCAGLVVLCKEIVGSQQPRLGLLNARVRRNAFGRQVDSFEAYLDVPLLGPPPFRGVFIRAPYLEEIWPPAEALATFEGKIVAARQDKILATAFHPELTADDRFHRYFISTVAG
ncbi:pyridoxal phosphate synthase yaaE subunit [Thermanaeromonas toyohensis ToBE]|uniref:Pyridoxal 5'-phosphate synthase subunit PdxT n=1 Tax=Thermanaeromonas toyohensis ToBE TaxID=698762 RepID=A0A1W1V5X1_9FIRM|nr:pyridoxal 5'-phosphate synthase glutaminase subunit PdxT [Thermanaeromonas toyohensis]SMB88451.1 pyridoxal phosphate synthase yaaE subunit [Thermanaeromonas toyohensis ToBE]